MKDAGGITQNLDHVPCGDAEEGPDDFTEQRAAGPERPPWLQRDSQDAPSLGGLQPGSCNAVEAWAARTGGRAALQEKERKWKKKKKKEKRHKEKRRKRVKEAE
jgi:hypothetical protein